MTSTIGPIPTLREKSDQHFGTLLRGFVACDALMLLFLTFGYIAPVHHQETSIAELQGSPSSYTNETLKASPFQVKTVDPRSDGRRPDVFYTRSQSVSVPVTVPAPPIPAMPAARVLPVTDTPVLPSSTAVALPLGVSY